MKNKTLFAWLLKNYHYPSPIILVRNEYGEIMGTPKDIFKVFHKDKELMYARIFDKEIRNHNIVMYLKEAK